MEIVLQKKKADAFVSAMEQLGNKFNNVYINGNLEDYAKLDKVDGRLVLRFTKQVPEMVRIACTMAFVETLL